ncbi:hypothetical protein SDC9_132856 [bioreactor metagenome]|uniref:Uncharacterized protein n=1 Tax=bioreactor metagenome TaxID=1076179 RepID=A0A645D994_9ZZZZ
MAAGGIVAFEFVENSGRGVERLFEEVGPDQRRGPVHLVKIQNFFRNVEPGRGIVELLNRQIVAEHMAELLEGHRLKGAGIEQRSGLVLHMRPDVVPLLRHLLFFEIGLVRHGFVGVSHGSRFLC